jgi:hypothetical protein
MRAQPYCIVSCPWGYLLIKRPYCLTLFPPIMLLQPRMHADMPCLALQQVLGYHLGQGVVELRSATVQTMHARSCLS